MSKHTTFFIVLITLLLSVSVYSQPYGWYAQTSGTTSNLNNVQFFNTNTGTIVGQSGKILRTTNSGTNWVSQTSGTTNHLFGVHFLNTSTGWAVGDIGTILKTTNGGSTWVTQTSNILYQLRSITFLSQSTGYIVGWYGTILRTTNGGNSWSVLNTGTSNNLHGISFANSSTGFVVGWYGTIIKTTNGGNNWTTLSSGTTSTLEDVTFFDTQTGLIVGENGRLQKTTNGGTNWVVQSSGTGNWISGITSPHANFATMVGELGVLRTTTNGGTNWYSQVSNTGNWLHKINYVDTLNGWAVGDYGTIIHTTTGGWLLPTAPSLSSPSNNSTCISLTPTLSWNIVFPPVCTYRVQISTSSSFSNPLFDSSGILYLNFAVPASLFNHDTKYYWRVSATNQVGVGPWSSVRNFRTSNATPDAPTLSIPENNSNIGTLTPMLDWDSVAYASTFRIKISEDSTFATTIIDTSGLSRSKYLVPENLLQAGITYYWKVNGSNSCQTSAWSQTWNFQAILTITGNNGSELPKVFKLYDNYPNPFNPVTKIKFDLPLDNRVVLKIYDITGKEVVKLVDRNLSAGKYEYTWNAERFSSGVYFYRIEAGNFSDIKRMILVK